jgi:hypothetical protein
LDLPSGEEEYGPGGLFQAFSQPLPGLFFRQD